jgi:hypothetical protein
MLARSARGTANPVTISRTAAPSRWTGSVNFPPRSANERCSCQSQQATIAVRARYACVRGDGIGCCWKAQESDRTSPTTNIYDRRGIAPQ